MKVRVAMNEINAAQRMRMAAKEKAEADRIMVVTRAQGDAEAKFLEVEALLTALPVLHMIDAGKNLQCTGQLEKISAKTMASTHIQVCWGFKGLRQKVHL